MNSTLTVCVNNSEELTLHLPDELLESVRSDRSMLMNVVQEFVTDEIHSLEITETHVANKTTVNISDVDEDITINTEEKKLWSDDNIKLLIDLYKKYDDEFQTGVKKNTWNKLADLLRQKTGMHITGVQCDTKWKGLLRSYKGIKKHNSTTGNNPKYWKFYNIMDEILHKKPEITPVATCSSARGLQIEESRSDSITSEPPSGKSTPSPAVSTGIGIRKRSLIESNAERRHREKLDRQDRFLGILETIANNMQPKKHCKCKQDVVEEIPEH